VQLLEIGLYNHDGRLRSLAFRPGEFNIITGESQSGKSALIEIVHYCLGSTRLRVPHGVIADTVAWYALRMAVGSNELLIARPAPAPGRASSSAVMLEIANQVRLPDASELEASTNTETLIAYLSRLIGIEENVHVPPETATRLPLEATIAHALFFNFQRQDEIASREFLFHRQADEFVGQAIRDVLPYFLGAVDRDDLARRAELRRLRTDLQTALRQLERLQATRQREQDEAFSLVGEAAEVGLTDLVPEEGDFSVFAALLQAAVASEAGLEELSLAPGTAFSDLDRRRLQLADSYREVRDQIQLVRSFLTEQDGYVGEASEQAARLEAIKLLPDGGDTPQGVCPVCGQAADQHLPAVAEMNASLQTLSHQLDAVQRDTPRLQRLLETLEEQAQSIRGEIAESQRALEALAARDQEIETLRERVNAQSYIRGRIRHYLDGLEETSDEAVIAAERRVKRLRRQIEEAEERLSSDLVRENVVSILNVVGRDMADWARRLELEYSQFPVRIDVSRLNVVADTDAGTIPLERMGSAANWVGYHLVAYLALHKLFVDKNRPVPRFVILDQPTQAFYPPEALEADRLEGGTDADRAAVRRMLELLQDVAQELAPELQIIVTDHANLDETWFQGAITEEWRGGRKLIPSDWLG
jgi:energy-coupling factor transporter ATP-binding protein EcfA2